MYLSLNRFSRYGKWLTTAKNLARYFKEHFIAYPPICSNFTGSRKYNNLLRRAWKLLYYMRNCIHLFISSLLSRCKFFGSHVVQTGEFDASGEGTWGKTIKESKRSTNPSITDESDKQGQEVEGMICLFEYTAPSAIPIFQRDVTPLIDELKSFPAWIQIFDRTWLIATPENNIQTVAQRIERHLRDNDSRLLLVIGQANIEYTGRLPSDIWDWVNKCRQAGY